MGRKYEWNFQELLWWRGDYGALIDKLNIAIILLQMWVSMPIFEMLASVNHLLINLLWPSRCRSIKSLPQFSLQIFWNFWQREIFLQGNIKPAHHHRWPDPNFFSWLNFFTDLVWTKLFFESLISQRIYSTLLQQVSLESIKPTQRQWCKRHSSSFS